jgi:flagellar assembly protein FliH
MAAIIKSNAKQRQSQPTVYRYETFPAEAGSLRDNPEASAAAIIAEAQRQADEIRRQAAEEAQQAAEQMLDSGIEKRMEALLPIVRQAAAQLADAKQAWLRRWEQSAVQLAVKIAEKVIRREVTRTGEVTLNLVREALELAAGTQQMKIRLHPADFATFESQIKRLAQEISRGAEAVIVPDEAISRGGCRLETQHGVIDQQIETQLERIAAELTDSREINA